MPDPAQELNEQLRALETRAKHARKAAGLPYSRRETARATARTAHAVALQSISTWVAVPPARATIPSSGSSEKLLALVHVWSVWAGEPKTNERYWRDLLEKAQPSRARISLQLTSQTDHRPSADGQEATTDAEREQALGLAGRRSLARRLTRLSSTPADRRDDVLEWLLSQEQPFVEVPFGSVRVLVAPMGAGKSEEAEHWWGAGLIRAQADANVAVPVWLEARDLEQRQLEALLSGDLERECRIVIDDLDRLSPWDAHEVLAQARRLVLTWSRLSVLATTRPGASEVDDRERIEVAPWHQQRGLELLRIIVGDPVFHAVKEHEARQLLTSPLLVHALARRLRAGGDTSVSTQELLAGLASSVLRQQRRPVKDEVWGGLVRLAALVMDSAGQVKASSFGRDNEVWELEETGLVVRDDGRLRFALPLFEQHFAAQALQDGITHLEEAASPENFPRWRYAVAFAIDTAAADKAVEFMSRLVRANPAAASWVLDEISTSGKQASQAGMHPDSGEESALAAGRWLRDAMQAWTDGLGKLPSQLTRQHSGVLGPWGVRLEGDFMLLAVAREGVLNADLVARPDLQFGAGMLSEFDSIDGFTLPTDDLSRWIWARNRLRKALSLRIQRRDLPVPSGSPLAAERIRFLARHILSSRRLPHGAPIPVRDLRLEVQTMMKQVESSRWSTWQASGDTIDSGDIRWLHTELQHIHDETLAAPYPPADQMTRARFVWQAYSPELTWSITSAVLQNALIGYKQLVETNFPRFGHALALYSIMPARADGLVITAGPDESDERPPILEYRLRTDNAAHASYNPVVNLHLVEESDVPARAWTDQTEGTSAAFQVPEVTQEAINTHHERQATNLAYSWLARDLHAIGWLEHRPLFIR